MRIPGTKYRVSPMEGGGSLVEYSAMLRYEAPIPVAEVSSDGNVRTLSAITGQDLKGILFRAMCRKTCRQPAGMWDIGLLRTVGVDALPAWFLREYLATRRSSTAAAL